MDLLRLYLLCGLVFHKAVWEIMKRRSARSFLLRISSGSLLVLMARLVKLGILAGMVLQLFLPDMLPISTRPLLPQAAGMALFTSGLIIAVFARWRLGDNWTDIETAGLLKEQELVSKGVYRFIRHPIYVGDFLLVTGFELALNSMLAFGAILLVPIIVRQAIREEAVLTHNLPGYEDYRVRTKRFVPFFF